MSEEVMWTPEDLALSKLDGQLGGRRTRHFDFDGDYSHTSEAGAAELTRFYNMYPFFQGDVPIIEKKDKGKEAVEELYAVYSFMKV